MKALVNAGMDRVRMGIQSGSSEAKKIYNRNIPNPKIINSARIINKFSKNLMLTGYDLILDNPFESNESVCETINLLSRLPAPYTLNLFSLTYYPGTNLFDMAMEAGLIKDKEKDVYCKHYHDIQNTYLNFIIVLFSIFKLPSFFLKIMMKEKYVRKNKRVPKIIFNLARQTGYFRRAVDFLLKGDPHTLMRHLKAKIFK